jgi:hypothetical protein
VLREFVKSQLKVDGWAAWTQPLGRRDYSRIRRTEPILEKFSHFSAMDVR